MAITENKFLKIIKLIKNKILILSHFFISLFLFIYFYIAKIKSLIKYNNNIIKHFHV